MLAFCEVKYVGLGETGGTPFVTSLIFVQFEVDLE